MQAPNTGLSTKKRMMGFLAISSMIQAINAKRSEETASHNRGPASFIPMYNYGGIGEYHPKCHTIQTYRSQQRAARKRRRAR